MLVKVMIDQNIPNCLFLVLLEDDELGVLGIWILKWDFLLAGGPSSSSESKMSTSQFESIFYESIYTYRVVSFSCLIVPGSHQKIQPLEHLFRLHQT
jgi:hypothetical protein